MNNPFENKDGAYLALINDEGQYSLWPVEIKIPTGWQSVHQGGQQECLDYINSKWTDMRPNSLIEAATEKGK